MQRDLVLPETAAIVSAVICRTPGRAAAFMPRRTLSSSAQLQPSDDDLEDAAISFRELGGPVTARSVGQYASLATRPPACSASRPCCRSARHRRGGKDHAGTLRSRLDRSFAAASVGAVSSPRISRLPRDRRLHAGSVPHHELAVHRRHPPEAAPVQELPPPGIRRRRRAAGSRRNVVSDASALSRRSWDSHHALADALTALAHALRAGAEQQHGHPGLLPGSAAAGTALSMPARTCTRSPRWRNRSSRARGHPHSRSPP